jgi:putative transposase
MADEDRLSYKIDYHRNLPHIQPPGASLFVTFRLAGSLPVALQHALQAEAEEQYRTLLEIADPAERARKQY